MNLNVDTGTVDVNNEHFGFHLGGPPGSNERLIVKRKSIAASILAPYKSWDQLASLASYAWGIFSEAAAYKDDILRVGLRYVNRIDIPPNNNDTYDVKDFLTFTYDAPQPPLSPSDEFVVSTLGGIGGDECKIRIVSSTAPPMFPKYGAVILDLDVFSQKPISTNPKGLWDLVERMREHKNVAFEACITDQARKLFNG